MPFTPIESSVGGALIGISICVHAFLHGRVTGISGILSNVLLFPASKTSTGSEYAEKKRLAIANALYVLGLLTAGFLLRNQFHLPDPNTHPLNAENSKSVFGLVGSLVIGALTGLGTLLMNGCTSGHMICGMARLSKRSFVATGVFCLVTLAVVKLNLSPELNALIVPSNASFFAFPSMYQLLIMFLVVSAIIVVDVFLVLRAMNFKKLAKHDPLRPFSYFWNAITFGSGLVISGMANPAKVLGFFAFGTPAYDPSLFCVALLAILPSLVLFQLYIIPESKKSHNTACYQEGYCMPTASQITLPLLVGAATFGLAWGLSGVCPGPALVSAGGLTSGSWVWLVGFAIGAFGSQHVRPMLERAQ